MHFRPLISAFGRGRPLPTNSGGYVENPYGLRLEANLRSKGLVPETISAAMFRNTHFLSYLKDKLGYPTEQEVSEYITFLKENNAPQAAALASAALQFFFLHVLGEGLDGKKGPRLPLLLSPQEIDSLLSAAKSLPDKILLELLYHCGLRPAEAVEIKLSDINLKEKTVSAGGRIIPLPPALAAHLEFYLRLRGGGNNFLFTSGRTPLSPAGAQKIVEGAARAAGVDLHPDSLRYSAAAHLLQQGTELDEIQRIFGP